MALPPEIVSRWAWGAEAPRKAMLFMHYPVGTVFIHHTVTQPTADPKADARTVQRVAFSRDFADVSYQFLVSRDGTGLEGRELRWQGAHTRSWNDRAVGIALIGNYEELTTTANQAATVTSIIRWLKGSSYVTSDAAIRGHRDVSATVCPGSNAYNELLPTVREALSIREEDDMPAYIHEIVLPSDERTIAVPPPQAGIVPAGRVFVSFGVDFEATSVRAIAGRPDHWYGVGPDGAWQFSVPIGRKVWAELTPGTEVVSVINMGNRPVGVLIEVGRQ